MAQLVVKGLGFHKVNDHITKRTYQNISFAIEKGDIAVISFDESSALQNFIQVITGTTQDYVGTINYYGQNIKKLTDDEFSIFRRRELGVVSDDFCLFDCLSINDNIKLPLSLDGVVVDINIYRDLITLFNLENIGEFLVCQLDEQQNLRVRFARALLQNPALLIIDGRVFNDDDHEIMKLVFEYVKKNRITTCVISPKSKRHYFATRLITIENGIVIDDGVLG